jgi:hypothetical protein
MQRILRDKSKTILIGNKILPAAKCETCGAKIYPRSLLKPHVTHHQQKQRWFMKELRELQYTMAHMRNSA